jgi:uncharacterized membrane protein
VDESLQKFKGGSMRKRFIPAFIAIFALVADSQAASFQGIGYFTGNTGPRRYFSEPWGVSGDGSTVYGSSLSATGMLPFRWTAETGIESLGDLPGGWVSGYALASSYDGSVIVGTSHTTNTIGWNVHRAYTWTEAAGMRELPQPDDPFHSHDSTCAFALSADGRTVLGLVGQASSGLPFEDYKSLLVWDLHEQTAPEVHRTPSMLPPRLQWLDASADGSTALLSGGQNFIWSSAGFEETIPWARRLSPDGSTILGALPIWGEGRDDSFVWTKEGGHKYIGTIDGWTSNHATAISYDGSTVVGKLFNDIMQREDHAVYIWNERDGLRLIQDMLENDFGLDLTGWILTNATGISYDGLTIVGTGINPYGYEEGWIATIPEPATLVLVALGAFALRRKPKPRLP